MHLACARALVDFTAALTYHCPLPEGLGTFVFCISVVTDLARASKLRSIEQLRHNCLTVSSSGIRHGAGPELCFAPLMLNPFRNSLACIVLTKALSLARKSLVLHPNPQAWTHGELRRTSLHSKKRVSQPHLLTQHHRIQLSNAGLKPAEGVAA